jgi:hypothetical protein
MQRSPYGTSLPGAGTVHHIKSADEILASIKRFCQRTLDANSKLMQTSESGH